MKKVLFLLMFTICISISTKAQDDKEKVKPTSTIPQKVNNTFSKNKKYKGYKAKHKHSGRTKKHKVDLRNGEQKIKADNN